MIADPRPYRDEADFEAMLALLQAGRAAHHGCYYVHSGDLSWWLFYSEADANPWQHVYVWEGEGRDAALMGWALLSPRWRTFDVFVHPSILGAPQARAMTDWAAGRIAGIVRQSGGKDIRSMWIAEGDAEQIAHLKISGFTQRGGSLLQYQRRLEERIDSPEIPSGFYVRRLAGEAEAPLRAEASHTAFESEMPMQRYLERYTAFMRSPVYRPEMDLVAVAPDGRAAAFCIAWLDLTNRVGLFEPVGTHPEFRRMGLGKAVLAEGMRRMMAYGMQTVIVCAEEDNPTAQNLYRSAGFEVEQRLLTFAKDLD
jgi:ribosomal protein S18 acetylase RimI-like enzyme